MENSMDCIPMGSQRDGHDWVTFTFTHIHTWLLEKPVVFDYMDFVSKVMSLLFNTLSRFVIAFLPRGKHLLIFWLESLSAVILEPKKIKSVTVSIVSPSICHVMMGLDAMIFVFWMLNCKPALHSPLSPSSSGYLVFLHFLLLMWYHLHFWGNW